MIKSVDEADIVDLMGRVLAGERSRDDAEEYSMAMMDAHDRGAVSFLGRLPSDVTWEALMFLRVYSERFRDKNGVPQYVYSNEDMEDQLRRVLGSLAAN